jgi:hypothetical protein
MHGIQVLVWPLVGLVMAAGLLLFRRHLPRADVLLAGAFAASVGGMLGQFVSGRAWTIEGAGLFGMFGAALGAAVALAAIAAKAERHAH